MDAIIVALITGGLSLVGVLVSNFMSSNAIGTKLTHQLEVSQAVTNEKIDNLRKEVTKHNNFAERIPVIEANLASMDKRLTKLEDIERDKSL